jgi:hypothetical protein
MPSGGALFGWYAALTLSAVLCALAVFVAWKSFRSNQYRVLAAIGGAASIGYLAWVLPFLYVAIPNYLGFLRLHA